MKDMMIASVREKVGYDDSFFFNNRMKTRMERRTLTWTECVEQLKQMSEEQERNVERTLIDEGPYKVRPECRRLVVSADKWLTMTAEQKEGKLKAFQTIAVSEAFGVRASCATTSKQDTIFDAATEGMPSSSGKKPGQSRRRGGRRNLSSPRDTTGFQTESNTMHRNSAASRKPVHMHMDIGYESLQVLRMRLPFEAKTNWPAK